MQRGSISLSATVSFRYLILEDAMSNDNSFTLPRFLIFGGVLLVLTLYSRPMRNVCANSGACHVEYHKGAVSTGIEDLAG